MKNYMSMKEFCNKYKHIMSEKVYSELIRLDGILIPSMGNYEHRVHLLDEFYSPNGRYHHNAKDNKILKNINKIPAYAHLQAVTKSSTLGIYFSEKTTHNNNRFEHGIVKAVYSKLDTKIYEDTDIDCRLGKLITDDNVKYIVDQLLIKICKDNCDHAINKNKSVLPELLVRLYNLK